MDNCSCHKVKGVVDPIIEAGASVTFLPSYSPDLDLLNWFDHKFKSHVKKMKARSFDSLVEQIMPALVIISLSTLDVAHDSLKCYNWYLFDDQGFSVWL